MNNPNIKTSQQWRQRPDDERFASLEELSAAMNARRAASEEIDLPLSEIRLSGEGGGMVVSGGLPSCVPTHWSFGQMCTVAGAPAGYLRTLPTPLAIDCLKHGFGDRGGKPMRWLLRQTKGEAAPPVLSALTTTGYGRIWDAEIADAIMEVMPRITGSFKLPTRNENGRQVPAGAFSSDRDSFIFFVDQGDPVAHDGVSPIRRGLILWNSETGGRKCGLSTFLFHELTGGVIIHGMDREDELSFRHSKNAPARFSKEIVPQLERFTGAVYGALENEISQAKGYLLPADETDLGKWFRSHGLTNTEAKVVKEGIDQRGVPNASLWDVITMLSAYNAGNAYADARVDVGRRVGLLLKLVLI